MTLKEDFSLIKRNLQIFAVEFNRLNQNIINNYDKIIHTLVVLDQSNSRFLSNLYDLRRINSEICYKAGELLNLVEKQPFKFDIDFFEKLDLGVNEIKNSIKLSFDKTIEFRDFLVSLTNDKILLGDIYRLFEKYNDDLGHVNFLILKILSISNSNWMICKSLSVHTPVRRIFSISKNIKKVTNLKVANINITLQTISRFDLDSDEINNTSIRNYIFIMAAELLREVKLSGATFNFLIYLDRVSSYDLKEGLTRIIHNTILKALNNNPKIIRASSKLDINVTLLNSEQRHRLRLYSKEKSSKERFSFYFFVTPELIQAFLLGHESFDENQLVYEVVVHELTHSYDYNLSNSSNMVNYAIDLLKEDCVGKTIPVAILLDRIRMEGFAMFAGETIPHANINLNLVFILSSKIHKTTIKEFKEFFYRVMKNNFSNEDIANEASKLYSSGATHNYGLDICTLIFLAKMIDEVEVFTYYGDQNYRAFFIFKWL